jgi:hypothetical protein
MKDPASILGEINNLYRELFDLEMGTSKISREDLMETTKVNTVETSDPIPIDYQVRHDQIMSLIMLLTHEYVQITTRKA